MPRTEGMTLTGYRDKHDRVQTLQRYFDWFLSFCDCAGAQPTIWDSRADTHDEACPYRQRVEKEQG